jgi:hypothetical protein
MRSKRHHPTSEGVLEIAPKCADRIRPTDDLPLADLESSTASRPQRRIAVGGDHDP